MADQRLSYKGNLKPVEKFRLTKGQIEWMKAYKKVEQMDESLKSGLQIRFGELEQMQKMHSEVTQRKVQLLEMAPIKEIKELPGQEKE